jgi:opacity protein-like surface antigen
MLIATDLMLITPIDGGTFNHFVLRSSKSWWCCSDTLSIGAKYEVFERVSFDANYRLAQKLYASIDPTNFSTEVNNGSLELPSYD